MLLALDLPVKLTKKTMHYIAVEELIPAKRSNIFSSTLNVQEFPKI